MSRSLLTALLRALQLCVIERDMSEPSALRLLTPAPIWLYRVFENVSSQAGQALGTPIPFLEHFLPQAEAAWHEGHKAAASSGPFTVTVEGEEVLLVAMAVSHEDRRFLMLRRLTGNDDLRPILQLAREQNLEQERLVRQIRELRPLYAAIDRDSKILMAASLSPDRQALVERLSQALAEVQAVLASLPAEASRPRRQARPK